MIPSLQAGLIGKWKDNTMEDFRKEGRQRRRKLGNENEKASAEVIIKPLTLVHMQGPFLLYVVCVIVSFAAFLGEVVRVPFFRCNKRGSI